MESGKELIQAKVLIFETIESTYHLRATEDGRLLIQLFDKLTDTAKLITFGQASGVEVCGQTLQQRAQQKLHSLFLLPVAANVLSSFCNVVDRDTVTAMIDDKIADVIDYYSDDDPEDDEDDDDDDTDGVVEASTTACAVSANSLK